MYRQCIGVVPEILRVIIQLNARYHAVGL